jgi:2-iminoacetate synthase
MKEFHLDPDAMAATRERAASRAGTPEVLELLEAARRGESLDDESLVALFLAPRVATEVLFELAGRRLGTQGSHIETFSPLYITNTCDAECAMCGMRRFNDKLQRETADEATIEAQLDILHERGLRGVAILTGEYHHGQLRDEMLARAASALDAALARGFRHVLINVGALECDEYDRLLANVPRDVNGRVTPQVTMCTFQETYSPNVYTRFMGSSPDNPRSDFERRLRNFDRAADAGMWSVNPGVLLGLNKDVAQELLALLAHVAHLRSRGLTMYLSVPRLRKASGAEHHAGVGDDELIRAVALLALAAPDAKVVISTREAREIQHQLLPIIGVLTPGSPGVAPYTATGARFEIDASQFEVLDERPIEAILGEMLAAGATIDCYQPPATA